LHALHIEVSWSVEITVRFLTATTYVTVQSVLHSVWYWEGVWYCTLVREADY